MRPCVIACLLLLASLLSAQPVNLPCRTYGRSLYDQALAIAPADKDGYVLAGWSTIVSAGDTNIMLVRTDSFGNPLGNARVSTGDFTDIARSIVRTTDGGYAITGWTYSYGALPGQTADIFVIRLDANLNTLWAWVYGGTEDDKGYSIIQTSDGGFAVCGYTNSYGQSPWPNAIVLKLDPAGNATWWYPYHRSATVPFVHAGNDEAFSICEVNDPPWRYAVVGRMQRVSQLAPYDGFLLRLDPLGAILGTQVTQRADVPEEAHSVIWDGMSACVAGWAQQELPSGVSAEPNAFVWREPGSLLPQPPWSYIYGWIAGPEAIVGDKAVVGTGTGFAVTGMTHSVGPGTPSRSNLLLLQVDPLGNPVWCRAHPSQPGANNEAGWGIVRQASGKLTAAGMTSSFGNGPSDFHLVAVDANGNRPVCVTPADPLVAPLPVEFDQMERDVFGPPLDMGPMPGLVESEVGSATVCPVPVPDVGPSRVLVPTGTIDSTFSITPSCEVTNWGTTTGTYRVWMTIGSFYVDDTLVQNHPPGTTLTVIFDPYDAWPRGTHIVRCSTGLATDVWPVNDTLSDVVNVNVRDMGCYALLAPAGTIDSGTLVAPVCSVYNYGNTQVNTFPVRMTVRNGGTLLYDQSQSVSNLAPGARTELTFTPDWLAEPIGGPYLARCSTGYLGDMDNSSDTADQNVSVRRPLGYDVGCTKILVPSGVVDSGAVRTPVCSLYNYGTFTVTYDVRLKVADGFEAVANVVGHASHTYREVTFPTDWTAVTPGIFEVKCSTELTVDDTPEDDRALGSVRVRRLGPDVGATRVVAPAGGRRLGTLIIPVCSLYNYGITTESYTVRMRINGSYDTTAAVVGHAPATYQRLTFPLWSAGPLGTHEVRVYTELAGDLYPDNDTALGSVTVNQRGTGGWEEMTPMPEPLSNKPAAAGAWLAYSSGNGRFYAAKGNKTDDFYTYNPQANNWLRLQPVPGGDEDRFPYNGSTGCADGEGRVFVVKGNNTRSFYSYHIDGDSWHHLEDVPLGPSGKRVKAGAEAVYCVRDDTGYVYLLKGYKNEFYRFNTVSGIWEELPSAPTDSRPKYDKGSFLVYDGGNYIYAHKAKYHELYRFDLAGSRWDTAAHLAGMPFVSPVTGQTKKSKDGGSGTYYAQWLFALKGGNTQQFWRYDPDGDTWHELDTFPSWSDVTQRRKKVKGGGDITSRGDGALYALKGNKTRELWRFLYGTTDEATPRLRRDGVAAGSRRLSTYCRLTITPNPLTSGFAVLHWNPRILDASPSGALRIFDAAGRCVLTRALHRGQTSDALSPMSVTLDLRGLSSGVYLVRVTDGRRSATCKLVVEH